MYNIIIVIVIDIATDFNIFKRIALKYIKIVKSGSKKKQSFFSNTEIQMLRI